jgi:hypothetical protein
MKKIYFLGLLLTLTFQAFSQNVVINEINADNPGGQDTREFIELFSAPFTSLDSMVLVFFDGATNMSYNAIDLDGYACDNQGFFVVGNALAVNVDLIFTNGIFQNGADAVALYQADAVDFPNGTPPTGLNLVDAQVYGTNDAPANNLITGLTLDVLFPGYVQFDETAQNAGTDLTQSRIPDGGAAFANSAYMLQTLTPGTWNQPPCVGGVIASTSALSFCSNVTSLVELTTSSVVGQYLYVIADGNNNIVDTTSFSFDFNGLPSGVYGIKGFAYSGQLNMSTLISGSPISQMTSNSCFAFSTNTLTVNVNQCSGCDGAAIAINGAANSITVVSNAVSDFFNFTNTSASLTATYVYLLVDANGAILSTVDNSFDFNALPVGSYSIVGYSYEGALTGTDSIQNISGSICGEVSSNVVGLNVIQINSVVINEINADNPGGTDTAEFIELFGSPNASLSGLTMVFYDGATGNSYAAYDLDGYATDNFGFFVLGNVGAANVDFVIANGTLQNGADAAAVHIGNAVDFPNGTPASGNNLMDAQVYGTNDGTANNLITGLTLNTLFPGYTQFDETAQVAGTDLTQSRIPDGGAPFNVSQYVLQTLTPGTWNQPPCNVAVTNFSDTTTSVTACDFEIGTLSWFTTGNTGNSLFIITDANGLIVDTTSSNNYNFTGWAVGYYQIYTMAYTGNLSSVVVGDLYTNVTADICSEKSPTAMGVTINLCSGCSASNLNSDFGMNVTIIADTVMDVIHLTNNSTSLTDTYLYALTDTSNQFIQWINADFDFNTLGVGDYHVWGLSYEGVLTSISAGTNVFNASASNCMTWTQVPMQVTVIVINPVVINELNADNPGGPDTAEFIELYGSPNVTLDGITVVLFDGTSGLSYLAFDLDGYTTDSVGFFMIGNAGVASSDIVIPNASIQNGADAIALYIGNAIDFPNGTVPTPNHLIDAMVYGTADATANNLIVGLGLDVLVPGYAQFDETAQQTGIDLTQSRIPDGGPAFINSNVFLQELTPNAYNIVILGCTDAGSCNFNPAATVNDNSCFYPGNNCDDNNANTFSDSYNAECICVGVVANYGCMNPAACNYSFLANADDGSCIFPGGTCDDADSTTLVDIIDMNCLCNGLPLVINGCTDTMACNFNPAANTEDGTCTLTGGLCDDGDALTINDMIMFDCTCLGIMPVMGCMDSTACNYDPMANVSDTNCIVIGSSCDDGNAATINDVITVDCLCAGTEIVGVTESGTNEWGMYPNPTDGKVTIRSQQTIDQVSVKDALGRIVLNLDALSSKTIEINAGEFNSGVYHIMVVSGEIRSTRKLVVR